MYSLRDIKFNLNDVKNRPWAAEVCFFFSVREPDNVNMPKKAV